MKKCNGGKSIFAFCFIIIAAVFWRPIQAYASEATVTFGSESYSEGSNEEFPIGVYIRGDSKVGIYYVEVEYDTERMKYTGGGDSEQDGVIILQGTGLRDEVKYMLHFQAVGGGDAGIRVRNANVQAAAEDGGGEFTVTAFGSAPVTIAGIDETGVSFFERLAEEAAAIEEAETVPETVAEKFGLDTDIPILAAVDMGGGNRYYIVDHALYIPESVGWSYRTAAGTYGEQQVTFLTNTAGTVKLLYLMDAEENFYPYAYNGEEGLFYSCYAIVQDEEVYYYMSPHACSVWPEELTIQAITADYVFFAMDSKGNGGFYQLDADGRLAEWNPEQSKLSASVQIRKLVYIIAAACAVIAVVCICAYRAAKTRKKKREKYKRYAERKEKQNQQNETKHEPWLKEEEQAEEAQDELEFYDEDWAISEDELEQAADGFPEETEEEAVEEFAGEFIVEAGKESAAGTAVETAEENTKETAVEVGEDYEPPVISVQDVTMIFHISTSNASGIKEYLIQLMKRQITFRELVALDHVSFDVFKGEVVGIIGTNGSGKSTLLRIVSGALNPTSGQVVVDRRKVQLLTLGTGFDMELSAKENIYLNGSIIGYSREFLDSHYEEIVEFAELQDFMEEKVKNFSSGMVSRLGFAIATAGDAAEILILDEVLSVGDEFFRKKSLKRIKEMIHGGSTVLMVSHGMGTILDNCTKVVWIEKGKLQMVGEPKTVCGAYRKLAGDK